MQYVNQERLINYLENLVGKARDGAVYIDAIAFEKDASYMNLDNESLTPVHTGAFKVIIVGFGRLSEDKES